MTSFYLAKVSLFLDFFFFVRDQNYFLWVSRFFLYFLCDFLGVQNFFQSRFCFRHPEILIFAIRDFFIIYPEFFPDLQCFFSNSQFFSFHSDFFSRRSEFFKRFSVFFPPDNPYFFLLTTRIFFQHILMIPDFFPCDLNFFLTP